VHRLVACATRPGGVPAAVTETSLMAHQPLLRAKAVPVRASRRRVGDPLPVRGLNQIAQHPHEPKDQYDDVCRLGSRIARIQPTGVSEFGPAESRNAAR
jgi:hypothetical protein